MDAEQLADETNDEDRNPSPQEAECLSPLELQTILFRRNWQERNCRDHYWRRLHRNFARQAVAELRHQTRRQRKKFGPTHYGHT